MSIFHVSTVSGGPTWSRWSTAIPTAVNRGEQMVRYYGGYSNASRGKRLKEGNDDGVACIIEPLGAEKRFRWNGAPLI